MKTGIDLYKEIQAMRPESKVNDYLDASFAFWFFLGAVVVIFLGILAYAAGIV